MIDFFIKNKEFIGIVISIIGVITPLYMFLLAKRKEQQQINFERFHKNLMNGLSNQEAKLGLDEQIAIIYELRNYPGYFPVIQRILNFQIRRWTPKVKEDSKYQELLNEANETLSFINKPRFLNHFC